MRKLFLTCAFAVALFALAAPAKADTVIVFSDANGCGASNCFGNVFTLTIHPTGGNSYQVTLTVNTAGNTNSGSAIAGVTFKFAEITSAVLTAAPPSTAGWVVATATLSANGCDTGSQSPACTFDSAFLNTLNSPTATAGLASLPNNGTYTWMWNVQANGPIDVISVRALFGTMDPSTIQVIDSVVAPSKGQCPSGYVKQGNDCVVSHTETAYSFKATGLTSSAGTTQVPEPGTLALLGLALAGLAGFRRFRS